MLALGKAALRGVEKVVIWGKLAVISAYFPNKDTDDIENLEQMYDVLLELVRYA